jgi:hypothetical protein
MLICFVLGNKIGHLFFLLSLWNLTPPPPNPRFNIAPIGNIHSLYEIFLYDLFEGT